MQKAEIEPSNDGQSASGDGAKLAADRSPEASQPPAGATKAWRFWALALVLSMALNVGLFIGFRDLSARLETARVNNADVRAQFRGLQASLERGQGAVQGSIGAFEQINRELDELIQRAATIQEATTLALSDVRAAERAGALAVAEAAGLAEASPPSPIASLMDNVSELIGQETQSETIAPVGAAAEEAAPVPELASETEAEIMPVALPVADAPAETTTESEGGGEVEEENDARLDAQAEQLPAP